MLSLQEILALVGVIGVLGGWGVARAASWLMARRASRRERDHVPHMVRSLEADLRVAQRRAEDAEAELARQREQAETFSKDLASRDEKLAEQEALLRRLRKSLTEECAKTQNLRHELSAKVEETIRATVRVRDAETELSVMRAGSEAVADEVKRLMAEREELTGRLGRTQAAASGAARPAASVARLPLREPRESREG